MSGIHLQHLHPPFELAKSKTLSSFLHYLPGPCMFHIPGKNPSQCRVIVTLLHGNEPSGLKAIHRLLNEDYIPQVNTKVIIASVVAAKTEPVFTHRMLPGQPDLNRCFSSFNKDPQSQIAQAILEEITKASPQAVIDLHNTSGSGPSFCVSTGDSEAHHAMAAHFSHRLIVTDIRLGSLMEQQLGCPVITVEAGGAQDDTADAVAYDGILSFTSSEDVFFCKQHIETLHHPRRLELANNHSIAYADSALTDKSITLRQDIEKYNYGVTPENTCLGWVMTNTLDALTLDHDSIWLEKWFYVSRHRLMTRQPLKLFMVTTNAQIAQSDCLFYVLDQAEN